MRVVIDTNLLVSALLTEGGASRAVLRKCLMGDLTPLIGNALFNEYEDVLSRDVLFSKSPTTHVERDTVLDAFLSTCHWIQISYLWRPNLKDEADNHIIELATAGNATFVITGNTKDFIRTDLKLTVEIISPGAFITKGD